jgi:hypothetical protein
MGFESLEISVLTPTGNFFSHQLGMPNAHWLNRNVTMRLAQGLVLCPLSLFTCLGDGILGLGSASISLIQLGKSNKWTKLAISQLRSAGNFATYPMLGILRIINPSAGLLQENCAITMKGLGIITQFAYERLEDIRKSFVESDNVFVKHVVSRASSALLGLICLVTQVVDLSLALIAVPSAFLTLGLVGSIDNLAVQSLYISIPFTTFLAINGIINPNGAAE